VLRTACDRNRAWQHLGLPPIHIAVNLSARQIQDKNLVRSVAQILLETGLICPIGEWVLRTACDRNRAWQRLGLPPIHIAVNLSARQIQDKNLVRSVAEILLEIGLEPSYLDLEITESVAMQDIDLTISVLKALQNMGIQISMDDFGTGYSSLNALKHFPLTYLKIDKSFIRDLMNDSHDAAIIKAIVALGQGLNLKVIAEGVETKEQLDFLRSIGCDRLQGYLFSRPLPEEAATKLYIQQLGVNILPP
jgi:EAL domain-containing protein (putative c-di-GMP-specific phosphodiesterase class I)